MEEIKPQEKINSCPYVQWFEFKKCTIRSCKNYNDITENKCLAIDRIKPEGAKIISDAELHLYKLKDLNISTRLVQIKRKKFVDRVKQIVILFEYINFIKKNKIGGGVFTKQCLIDLEKEYPLKLKRLGWENWMWEYALDLDVWNEFVTKSPGECKEFELYQIFAVKQSRFDKLLSEFNQEK